jgi:hypothetical protein
MRDTMRNTTQAALFEDEGDRRTPGWVMPKLWPSATPHPDPPPRDHVCAQCSGPAANYWSERSSRSGGWRCLTCHASHRPHDRIRFADEAVTEPAV